MEKENTGKYAEKEKQSVLDNAAHSENDVIHSKTSSVKLTLWTVLYV